MVSLVTRAQIGAGWVQRRFTQTVYPNVPESSGARFDLAQFVAHAGAIPDAPDPTQPWADWDQPATREWTARVIWQAFSSEGGRAR